MKLLSCPFGTDLKSFFSFFRCVCNGGADDRADTPQGRSSIACRKLIRIPAVGAGVLDGPQAAENGTFGASGTPPPTSVSPVSCSPFPVPLPGHGRVAHLTCAATEGRRADCPHYRRGDSGQAMLVPTVALLLPLPRSPNHSVCRFARVLFLYSGTPVTSRRIVTSGGGTISFSSAPA